MSTASKVVVVAVVVGAFFLTEKYWGPYVAKVPVLCYVDQAVNAVNGAVQSAVAGIGKGSGY